MRRTLLNFPFWLILYGNYTKTLCIDSHLNKIYKINHEKTSCTCTPNLTFQKLKNVKNSLNR